MVRVVQIETGDVWEIDVSPMDNVAVLRGEVQRVTGVNVDQQFLCYSEYELSDARPISFYGGAGTDDHPIYLHCRKAPDECVPAPTLQSLVIEEARRPITRQPEGQTLMTLEDRQNRFRLHCLFAEECNRRALGFVGCMQQLLTELAFQLEGYHVARRCLQARQAMLLGEIATFEDKWGKIIALGDESLVLFEPCMQVMKRVSLHRTLLPETGVGGGADMQTVVANANGMLAAVVPEARLRQWIVTDCQPTRASVVPHVVELIGHFKNTASRVRDALRMEPQSPLFLAAQKTVQEFISAATEMARQQSTIAQSFAQNLNTSLLRTDISGLDALLDSHTTVMTMSERIDAELCSLTVRAAEVRMQVCVEVRRRMADVSAHRKSISQSRQRIGDHSHHDIYDLFLNKFSHLEVCCSIPVAYAALLAEGLRRRRFGEWTVRTAQVLSDILSRVRAQEQERREAFVKKHLACILRTHGSAYRYPENVLASYKNTDAHVPSVGVNPSDLAKGPDVNEEDIASLRGMLEVIIRGGNGAADGSVDAGAADVAKKALATVDSLLQPILGFAQMAPAYFGYADKTPPRIAGMDSSVSEDTHASCSQRIRSLEKELFRLTSANVPAYVSTHSASASSGAESFSLVESCRSDRTFNPSGHLSGGGGSQLGAFPRGRSQSDLTPSYHRTDEEVKRLRGQVEQLQQDLSKTESARHLAESGRMEGRGDQSSAAASLSRGGMGDMMSDGLPTLPPIPFERVESSVQTEPMVIGEPIATSQQVALPNQPSAEMDSQEFELHIVGIASLLSTVCDRSSVEQRMIRLRNAFVASNARLADACADAAQKTLELSDAHGRIASLNLSLNTEKSAAASARANEAIAEKQYKELDAELRESKAARVLLEEKIAAMERESASRAKAEEASRAQAEAVQCELNALRASIRERDAKVVSALSGLVTSPLAGVTATLATSASAKFQQATAVESESRIGILSRCVGSIADAYAGVVLSGQDEPASIQASDVHNALAALLKKEKDASDAAQMELLEMRRAAHVTGPETDKRYREAQLNNAHLERQLQQHTASVIMAGEVCGAASRELFRQYSVLVDIQLALVESKIYPFREPSPPPIIDEVPLTPLLDTAASTQAGQLLAYNRTMARALSETAAGITCPPAGPSNLPTPSGAITAPASHTGTSVPYLDRVPPAGGSVATGILSFPLPMSSSTNLRAPNVSATSTLTCAQGMQGGLLGQQTASASGGSMATGSLIGRGVASSSLETHSSNSVERSPSLSLPYPPSSAALSSAVAAVQQLGAYLDKLNSDWQDEVVHNVEMVLRAHAGIAAQLKGLLEKPTVPKLSFESFSIEDIVLFFPKEASTHWVAFATMGSPYFLSEDIVYVMRQDGRMRRWMLGEIVALEEFVASIHSNPFDLPDGTRYFVVDVSIYASDAG
eukprot:Opistho-2@11879